MSVCVYLSVVVMSACLSVFIRVHSVLVQGLLLTDPRGQLLQDLGSATLRWGCHWSDGNYKPAMLIFTNCKPDTVAPVQVLQTVQVPARLTN